MNRYEIINTLIKKNNYKSYLEIGTQFGNCFTQIDIEEKVCVDPIKNFDQLTFEMTSDDFFLQNKKNYDIIFVDGLHVEEQCTKDIYNSLKCLNENGTIVVHDCLPHCEDFIQVCHSGTVFRSIIELRYNNPNLSIKVVDSDCGCAVIQPTNQGSVYSAVPIELAKTYYYYSNNKDTLMNVITIEQFKQLYS